MNQCRTGTPRELVEHFFRHESGRLVAVLTRSLGVRRLDPVEDVVQAALAEDLAAGARRGTPDDPAGWLYRTARNLAVDALRREQTHARALPHLADGAERESPPPEAHFADEIGDEPLRLLFVCCHEAVPVESRVAFALHRRCSGRSCLARPDVLPRGPLRRTGRARRWHRPVRGPGPLRLELG